jgi:hypothetical protein
MPIAISQSGHGVRKTNVPLWKMLSGYLKRISNMNAVDTVDALVVYGSYRQSKTAGKFNMRAHFRKALDDDRIARQKDSTFPLDRV